MKKILFITWDSPESSYLEGLFCPIFKAIKKELDIEFHIFQFTWGKGNDKNKRLVLEGFVYNSMEVKRKPYVVIGTVCTIMRGAITLRKYIIDNDIDIVMPRSVIPAIMINLIYLKTLTPKIVYDADGLAIEERVDFAGLKRNGVIYRFLKKQEKDMLKLANAIITRSFKAIDIYVNSIGQQYNNKFFKVTNGRDIGLFNSQLDNNDCIVKREILGIPANATVFIYCGSLGPQYCWSDMYSIFVEYLRCDLNARFIVLTNSSYPIENLIPLELKEYIIIKSVFFDEVPSILSLCNIAFAIRKPSFSMQGVAPIKLAEYLLMGIPTIASIGIGDTEEMLCNTEFCYLYHNGHEKILDIVSWCTRVLEKSEIKQQAREFAIEHFSLRKSASDYVRVIEYIK